MKIEEIIGMNVRQAREESGLTGAEVGRKIGKWLRKEWPRQTVSLVESGKRAFTGEELLALALVLGKPLAYFFRVSSQQEVEMPSGATVRGSEFARLFQGDLESLLPVMFDEVSRARRQMGS